MRARLRRGVGFMAWGAVYHVSRAGWLAPSRHCDPRTPMVLTGRNERLDRGKDPGLARPLRAAGCGPGRVALGRLPDSRLS